MAYWERIKELADDFTNGDIAKFERKCELGNGYINKKPNSGRKSTINKVLSKFPRINRDWLEFGHGEKFNNNTDIQLRGNLINEEVSKYGLKNENIHELELLKERLADYESRFRLINDFVREKDARIKELTERLEENKNFYTERISELKQTIDDLRKP